MEYQGLSGSKHVSNLKNA